MYEGHEVQCPSVVARGDAAEVFEFVEATLDAVARLVDFEVVRDLASAPWIAGNDGAGPDGRNAVADLVAVIGLVGQNVVGLKALHQREGLRCIAGLARGEDDAERPAEAIGGEVDLGGQTSSGTPQSLVAVPPFPVAAC